MGHFLLQDNNFLTFLSCTKRHLLILLFFNFFIFCSTDFERKVSVTSFGLFVRSIFWVRGKKGEFGIDSTKLFGLTWQNKIRKSMKTAKLNRYYFTIFSSRHHRGTAWHNMTIYLNHPLWPHQESFLFSNFCLGNYP